MVSSDVFHFCICVPFCFNQLYSAEYNLSKLTIYINPIFFLNITKL